MSEVFWHEQAGYPLLAMLQLCPLLGGALVYALQRRSYAVPLAQGIAAAELLLAIDLYRLLDRQSGAMQMAERFELAGFLSYHAAADGVTLLFVLVGALLLVFLTVYAPERHLEQPGRLLAVLLTVEAVLVCSLTTLNLLWFVFASAAELGLVGYLLWRWAESPQKDLALARFYQFQGSGLLLLLTGTLFVGWAHADLSGGNWSFDLLVLGGTPVPESLASVVFFLLFYGLAVRTPLFPLHGWLPVVAQHGNVAIAPTLLLGVKVGIYGMVRFLFPLVPETVGRWSPYVMGFATAGVFYAAGLAFLQTNLRRLLAFAVVSHTGLIVMGLFTLHEPGLQGALLLSVNFGLAAAALLLMVGLVHRRTRTSRLDRLGGLFDTLPAMGVAFLAAGLAVVGMPGTPGFDAAHLVLEAAMARFGALLTVATALGNVVAAGFLLWAFQRAFLAPRAAGLPSIEPANRRELALASAIIAVLLFAGFYMEPWMTLVEMPTQALAARLGSH